MWRVVSLESEPDVEDTRAGEAGWKRRTTLQEAAKSNEDVPAASLLGLPGEIRNRIYREALVEENDISFFSNHPDCQYTRLLNGTKGAEPGLLRCCASIRLEARPTFLKENRSRSEIEFGKLQPQPYHWFWEHVSPGDRTIKYSDDIMWQNFVDWLRAYWEGEIDGDEVRKLLETETCHTSSIFGNAFEIVRELRSVRWCSVEAVLSRFDDAVSKAATQGWNSFHGDD